MGKKKLNPDEIRAIKIQSWPILIGGILLNIVIIKIILMITLINIKNIYFNKLLANN